MFEAKFGSIRAEVRKGIDRSCVQQFESEAQFQMLHLFSRSAVVSFRSTRRRVRPSCWLGLRGQSAVCSSLFKPESRGSYAETYFQMWYRFRGMSTDAPRHMMAQLLNEEFTGWKCSNCQWSYKVLTFSAAIQQRNQSLIDARREFDKHRCENYAMAFAA